MRSRRLVDAHAGWRGKKELSRMSIYTKLYGLQKQIRRTFQEAEVGTYASGAAFFFIPVSDTDGADCQRNAAA